MRLRGTVRLRGTPVEGAYVRLLGPSGEFTAELRTDESGTFLFYPSEGSWTLLGIAAGGRRVERHVEMSAGRTVEVDLEI